MKKAYLNAIEKIDSDNLEKIENFGSVSALVINGEKLVMAQMGSYKAIVCRDGMAHQLRPTHQHRGGKRHWPRRLISGMYYSVYFHCSVTGKITLSDTNFWPNCDQ